ncbi:hypothetical protein E8E14_002550 [Neopestalotiopsis sp. 37M]|nr:hypothetical protein E8E14_002550 [Neopestalotiopsis sp. 37M]
MAGEKRPLPYAGGAKIKRGRPSKSKDDDPEPNNDSTQPIKSTHQFLKHRNLQDLLEAPNPEWKAAEGLEIDEIKQRWGDKMTAESVSSGLRHPNYELQDVSKFTTMKWWPEVWNYRDAPARKALPDERAIQRNQDSLLIRGQTVLVNISTKSPGNHIPAAILCFDSVKAYMAWLDTQGNVFFQDFVTVLNDRANNRGVHIILETIANMESHRTFHILCGDVNPNSMPIEDRGTTHLPATILANVLAALMFCKNGLKTNERRFTPKTGEEANELPYHYGFHANHWMGMLIAFNHFHYRRTSSGRIKLDGKVGAQQNADLALAYVSPENMTGIVNIELGEDLPVNINSLRSAISNDNEDSQEQIAPKTGDRSEAGTASSFDAIYVITAQRLLSGEIPASAQSLLQEVGDFKQSQAKLIRDQTEQDQRVMQFDRLRTKLDQLRTELDEGQAELDRRREKSEQSEQKLQNKIRDLR